jgi:hypothetical protein
VKKEIYIVKGLASEGYPDFRERVFSMAEKIRGQSEPETLRLTLTLGPPPVISVIPFRKEKVAALSVTGGSARAVSLLSPSKGFIGRYLVEEAVPVAYQKTWEDGAPTPGICMLTLFNRKPGIDRNTFLERWHQGHTPLSLRIHPLWNYNRNVVLEPPEEDDVSYEGIVEEQFRERSQLLNPFRFFGPPMQVPRHMMQVLRDSRSFIDLKRIEVYLTTEYHLKS